MRTIRLRSSRLSKSRKHGLKEVEKMVPKEVVRITPKGAKAVPRVVLKAVKINPRAAKEARREMERAR